MFYMGHVSKIMVKNNTRELTRMSSKQHNETSRSELNQCQCCPTDLWDAPCRPVHWLENWQGLGISGRLRGVSDDFCFVTPSCWRSIAKYSSIGSILFSPSFAVVNTKVISREEPRNQCFSASVHYCFAFMSYFFFWGVVYCFESFLISFPSFHVLFICF